MRQDRGMSDLTRPVRGRIVAGVCAGLARRFNTSPTLIRVIFLVSMLLPGPQILIYLALWVIMPKQRP
jgi:phage shock protein PspC (stress-responsive transcriptional regulator)